MKIFCFALRFFKIKFIAYPALSFGSLFSTVVLSERGLFFDIPTIILFCFMVLPFIYQAFSGNENIINDNYINKYNDLLSVLRKSHSLVDNIIAHLLSQSANELNFKSQPLKQDRITIFIKKDGGFFALSRYSENNEFRLIDNSKTYRNGCGCISLAWDHAWVFDDELPDPINFDNYKAHQRRSYKYKDAEIRDFTMKSRLYASLRIQSYNNKSLGVIVLESEKYKRFSEEEAKLALSKLATNVFPLLEDIEDIVSKIKIHVTT
jgi:hypothetical protein